MQGPINNLGYERRACSSVHQFCPVGTVLRQKFEPKMTLSLHDNFRTTLGIKIVERSLKSLEAVKAYIFYPEK